MRKIPIWSLTILLLILVAAGWFMFQSRVTQVAPPVELPAHFGPPQHKQLEVAGTVIEYGSNPDGDIDKMLLATEKEKIWLHFPPHAARSVKSAAPVSSVIEAVIDQSGPRPHHPDAACELKTLKKPGSKASIDLTNYPMPPPRKGFEVEVKGNTLKDLKTGQGADNNFVLAGKMISVPPHMARELFPLIRQAKMILVKGYMRDSTEGFMSASGMPVVKANFIQLDNINYKIR